MMRGCGGSEQNGPNVLAALWLCPDMPGFSLSPALFLTHSLSVSHCPPALEATISSDAQSNQRQRLNMILRDSVHGGELMDLPVTIQRHMYHAVAQPAASRAGAGRVSLAFPLLHQLHSGATHRSDVHEGNIQ